MVNMFFKFNYIKFKNRWVYIMLEKNIMRSISLKSPFVLCNSMRPIEYVRLQIKVYCLWRFLLLTWLVSNYAKSKKFVRKG